MDASKQPKVEEIVISMEGQGGSREYITVPQGAVLSPITVSSAGGGGIQQWQTVKTTMAGSAATNGGQVIKAGQPQVWGNYHNYILFSFFLP